MSERQSILRMKVVGTETVKSDLASLEAAVRRQNTNFQRAFQVAEQKVRGGTPDANAAQENAQSMARQLAGTQALYNMTKKAREEGARAQLETRSEKEYVAAEMAKIKAVDVRTKQETKISQQAAKEKAAADQSYYKFTETMGERKLRILAEEYNHQRQLHAGNAQALARIDQAYLRQRDAIMAGGGGQGGGINGKEMQSSTLGALIQMGSKRILRQGAGMVAQQIGNVPGIGQEIGLIVGGALYGGPTIAGMATLGGIATVGAGVAAYYRSANETAKTITDSRLAYEKEHRRPMEFSKELNKPASTSLGDKYREEAKAAKDQAAEIIVEEKRRQAARGIIDRAAADWQTATSASGMSHDVIAREWARYRQHKLLVEAQRWDKIAKKEDEVASFQRGEDRGTKVASARVAAMHPGSAQRKAALDLEATLAYRAVNRDAMAEARAAKQIVNEQEKAARLAEIAANRNADIAALDKVYKYKEQSLAQKEIETAKLEQHNLVISQNAASKEGFDRERADLDAKHKKERLDYQAEGKPTGILRSIQGQEQIALFKKERRIEADSLRQVENETALVNRTRSQEEITLQELSINLERERGKVGREAAKELLEGTRNLFAERKKIELADIATNQRIRLGMIRGTMDPYEVKREELRRQNKYTPEEIKAIIQGEKTGDSAAFVKQERMQKSPKMQLDEYNKSLQQAITTGQMGWVEGMRRRMDKAQELLGPRQGGEFMDALSYSRSIQSKASADASIPKETRDAMRAVQKDIADMLRMGITIRG